MSNIPKMSFVEEAKQLAKLDSASDWRRLGGLIESACGGKKKDAHFKQNHPR
jgi:hypothetical protein